MEDCIFCKIAEGRIPSTKVYEDEDCLAFRDIAPQAPLHIILIPKRHIPSVQCLTQNDAGLIGRILCKVPDVAALAGVQEQGYRLITNVGEHGCQSVAHLHFHILGGRQLEPALG